MGSPRIYEPLWKSFYSGKFYQNINRFWNMKAMLFLALLSGVFAAAVIIKIHLWILFIQPFMRDDFTLVKSEISSISMENGKLTVIPRDGKTLSEDGIYSVSDNSRRIVAIINTESETIPDNLGGSKYYLSSGAIALRMNDKVERMNIVKTFSVSLDSEIFEIASGKGTVPFLLVVYPLVSVLIFVVLLCAGFVFIFPAYGTMRFFSLKMKFHKLLSVSIIAMTPAVMIYFLCAFMFNRIIINFVYVSMITIFYLYFAFKNIAQEKADNESAAENKYLK
jgi:hypothetical protein